MPRKKPFGDRILTAGLGPRLQKHIAAATTVVPPIQRGRYTRNGQFPDVALINAMNEQTNQGVLYRTKEVARFVGPVAAATAGALSNGIIQSRSAASGDRERWRFAFHTGKYAHAIRATVALVPQSSFANGNSYARLDVYSDTAEATLVDTVNFNHGAETGGVSGTSAGWDHVKIVTMYLDVSPDTDYYGRFNDVDGGRMLAASVCEMSSMTEHFTGYLPQNIAAGSNVLDVHRQNLVTLQYNLWRRGGATVLNWSVNGTVNASSPLTTTSATATNIIDGASTTISAATPGYTLYMTGKERASQASTGVGCRMEVFGHLDAAGADGRVYLKDSAGSTIASIVDQWTTSTPTWKSTTFNLPAGTDKYDIQFARNTAGRTFSLYAISIYEYEA